MTRTELLEQIRNGENSGVEFKRDTVEPKDLAQEIVALANLSGGRILLGVEDNGSISGITRGGLEQWVMNLCRDKIRPEVIPYYEVIRDVEPGKDVGVLEVGRGWAVHHVWHHSRRQYFIRVGTQSREASAEELERLFQQCGAFRVEIRPVSGSSAADLDLRRLREYFAWIRGQEVPADDDRERWRNLLINTEILSDEQAAFPCTVAGLLLFGRNPNRYLPQSGVSAAAYPGRDKDYATLERATLRGSMVALTGGGATAELLEPGLVEQTLRFIERNGGREAVMVEGRRIDRPAFPADVLREAVVNALVHRDYLLSATDIELSIYSDRLEIVSPGRLPNGITPERMKVGCRAARNQLLKDVMRDYGYLEHMGMGIPRKILRGMRQHNGTEPDLIEQEESFLLRLWR